MDNDSMSLLPYNEPGSCTQITLDCRMYCIQYILMAEKSFYDTVSFLFHSQGHPLIEKDRIVKNYNLIHASQLQHEVQLNHIDSCHSA